MANEYPFIKCLNPQHITNRYTGEKLTVSCGKCQACLNAKSAHWSTLCDLHEQDYKFCMFITLSYDNEHLPVIKPVLYKGAIEKYYQFELYSKDHRFPSKFLDDNVFLDLDNKYYPKLCQHTNPLDDEYFGKQYSSYFPYLYKPKSDFDFVEYMQKKCNLHGDLEGCIGVLCKDDLQKFIKRLRKHLFNETKSQNYEKATYYACGEYGTKHFRPHFHLLFYFNEWSTLVALPKAIHKAWKFGLVNFSLSRGRCSGYCSSYLNSFACVPNLLKYKAWKPFQIHSTHFAMRYYEGYRNKVYECRPIDLINHVRQFGEKEKSVSLWRTLNSTFFPRCRGFAKSDYGTLLRLYTVYQVASEYYKQESITDLAWSICLDSHQKYFDDLLVRDDWRDLFNKARLTKDFQLPLYKSLELIKTDLYISKHFINFCCNGDVSNCGRMFHKIQAFYKECDYQRLIRWYKQRNDFQNEHIPDFFWYDNYQVESEDEVLPNFEELGLYRNFRSMTIQLYNNKIKHKKQNELNYKFLQYE